MIFSSNHTEYYATKKITLNKYSAFIQIPASICINQQFLRNHIFLYCKFKIKYYIYRYLNYFLTSIIARSYFSKIRSCSSPKNARVHSGHVLYLQYGRYGVSFSITFVFLFHIRIMVGRPSGHMVFSHFSVCSSQIFLYHLIDLLYL